MARQITFKRVVAGYYEASNGAVIGYAPAPGNFWWVKAPGEENAHDSYPTLAYAKWAVNEAAKEER